MRFRALWKSPVWRRRMQIIHRVLMLSECIVNFFPLLFRMQRCLFQKCQIKAWGIFFWILRFCAAFKNKKQFAPRITRVTVRKNSKYNSFQLLKASFFQSAASLQMKLSLSVCNFHSNYLQLNLYPFHFRNPILIFFHQEVCNIWFLPTRFNGLFLILENWQLL